MARALMETPLASDRRRFQALDAKASEAGMHRKTRVARAEATVCRHPIFTRFPNLLM